VVLNIYFTLECNVETLYLHTLRNKAYEKISFNIGGLGRDPLYPSLHCLQWIDRLKDH